MKGCRRGSHRPPRLVHQSSCRSSRSQSPVEELTECERLGARWVEHHDSHLNVYNGRTIDNRWIVPHSPYLLLKYECHLNVAEVCASVESVKYLYKYVSFKELSPVFAMCRL